MTCPRRYGAAVAVLALAAAGCAGSATDVKRNAAPLPGTESCIFTVELNDWFVLDDSTLIVYAPMHKEPYLLKLFAPITGLGFRESLGFEDTTHNGQLCRGDYVVARGDVPQRMPIAALRQITPQQAQQLRAAHPT